MPAALITPIMVGAAVGAVGAVISGGNILKGALLGGIGGAIGSAFGVGAAGLDAAGAAAGSADAAVAAAGEAQTASIAASNAGASAAGAATAPAATTASTAAGGGMIGPDFSMGYTDGGTAAAAQPAVGPNFSTGFTDGGTVNGGLADQAVTANTGMQVPATPDTVAMNPTDARLAAGTAATPVTPGSSFLDTLFGKGTGMLNNRFAVDTMGRVISGFAAGQNQQAMLDARAKEIARAQEQARFGAQGSRYAPVGMINGSPFKA